MSRNTLMNLGLTSLRLSKATQPTNQLPYNSRPTENPWGIFIIEESTKKNLGHIWGKSSA